MAGWNITSSDAATITSREAGLLAGLKLLSQASTYAQNAGVDRWDFALEIDSLYAAGMTVSDLRWLVAKGRLAHGLETSQNGDSHRSFQRSDGFRFEKTTCLVFTPRGVAYASKLLEASAKSPPMLQFDDGTLGGKAVSASDHSAAFEPLKPHWDPTRRELCVAKSIVKRFRVPAPNQEIILGVFEEEGWPDQIDDPLPIRDDIDPRTRLHDTINRLNGCQRHALLRFHGNGSGTGISWELRRSDTLRRAAGKVAAGA